MPSKKQPSSMTYPSAPGSDVHHSQSFWSYPSLVSTPACSEHSVQTQRSKDNHGRLRVLLDYPAHSKNTHMLEEADIWRAEQLRVKLSAMAQACREWEQALEKGNALKEQIPKEADLVASDEALKPQQDQSATLQSATLQSAAEKISLTMKEHGLTFDIVVSEQSDDCEWSLFMSGLLVAKGQRHSSNELFTASFYEDEMKLVKVSSFYREKYFA